MDLTLGILIGLLVVVGGGWLIVRHNNRSRVRVKPESNTPRPTVEPATQPQHHDIRIGKDRSEYRPYSAAEYNRIKSEEQIRQSGDDGFLTSMAVAAATDNAMLGMVVGGNPAGAIIGDMLNQSDNTPSMDFSTPDPSPSYDPGPSMIDSSPSIDYGSSCDSISSCDSTSFSCDTNF